MPSFEFNVNFDIRICVVHQSSDLRINKNSFFEVLWWRKYLCCWFVSCSKNKTMSNWYLNNKQGITILNIRNHWNQVIAIRIDKNSLKINKKITAPINLNLNFDLMWFEKMTCRFVISTTNHWKTIIIFHVGLFN